MRRPPILMVWRRHVAAALHATRQAQVFAKYAAARARGWEA